MSCLWEVSPVEVVTEEADGGDDGEDDDAGVRLATLLQQALPHPGIQQNVG